MSTPTAILGKTPPRRPPPVRWPNGPGTYDLWARRERWWLAGRLLDLRYRLGETQEQFRWHFRISRQTYRHWERNGPPQGPSTLLVRLMIRKLDRRARDRERWRARKRQQRAATKSDKLLRGRGE